MITLLTLIALLSLVHLVYESILAPWWRLSLRYKLFVLRDELRNLKIESGDALDDKHFRYLQDSINTMIKYLARYDVASLVSAELNYRQDPQFRREVAARSSFLDDCNIPKARELRQRSVRIAGEVIAINSGMLAAPFGLMHLMGIGVSWIRNRVSKFASFSRSELDRVSPSDLSASVS